MSLTTSMTCSDVLIIDIEIHIIADTNNHGDNIILTTIYTLVLAIEIHCIVKIPCTSIKQMHIVITAVQMLCSLITISATHL